MARTLDPHAATVKANGGLVYHEGFNWKAGA